MCFFNFWFRFIIHFFCDLVQHWFHHCHLLDSCGLIAVLCTWRWPGAMHQQLNVIHQVTLLAVMGWNENCVGYRHNVQPWGHQFKHLKVLKAVDRCVLPQSCHRRLTYRPIKSQSRPVMSCISSYNKEFFCSKVSVHSNSLHFIHFDGFLERASWWSLINNSRPDCLGLCISFTTRHH